MTTRCAVLGQPIAHSLSPVLHRAAHGVLGLDWSYDAVEVGEDGLAALVGGLGPEWRGLSLTMPLKRAVLPLLDAHDDAVARSGVANTVVLDGGRRVGANTDIPGAVAAIGERAPGTPASVLVLGGGATAASVLLAVADMGCTHALLAVRDPVRAAETLDVVRRHPQAPQVEVTTLTALADDGPVTPPDLVVSTIPTSAQSDRLVAALSGAPAAFDVVYDPWPTPLVEAVVAGGGAVVSGLDLLVHQAVIQVGLMTGADTDGLLAPMRAAGEAALEARA